MDSTFKEALERHHREEECWGIYGYADEDGNVIYIGIDRHIDKAARHKDHLQPSKLAEDYKYKQRINEYLQTNEGWEYIVLVPNILNKELAYAIETTLINEFDPPLNTKKQA